MAHRSKSAAYAVKDTDFELTDQMPLGKFRASAGRGEMGVMMVPARWRWRGGEGELRQ